MKLIKTVDAVGHVICHDMTQIIPGVTKDARFRKGHVITQEDIPVLLSMGKENLYVWEKRPGMLHEDEAAIYLRDICLSLNMHATEPKEGKIELVADIDGLFQVNVDKLDLVNFTDNMMIATRHTNTAVKKGDKLAGTRIIPLVIEKRIMDELKERAGSEPILKLTPWKLKTAGIVTTGSEVKSGLIEDKFTPVIEKKLLNFGVKVIGQYFPGDDMAEITKSIMALKAAGADMVLCTGGMSVDLDDRTPGAIKATGARVVTYGAPVLPGAMLMLSYFDDGIPVMGLPGCAMYSKATIVDLLLPRLVAGVEIKREDILKMGHGGLCLGCKQCNYPVCPFGKI